MKVSARTLQGRPVSGEAVRRQPIHSERIAQIIRRARERT